MALVVKMSLIQKKEFTSHRCNNMKVLRWMHDLFIESARRKLIEHTSTLNAHNGMFSCKTKEKIDLLENLYLKQIYFFVHEHCCL